MNLKKLYIYSAILTFFINNGSILMSDIEEVREAKSKLKFRTDLSMESKKLQKDINKEVFRHVLMSDILTLGVDFIPFINAMFSVYIFRNRVSISSYVRDYADERVQQINEIEEMNRHINYKYYLSIVEENNLEPLIDVNSKDELISYRELINLIKTHDLDPCAYIDKNKEVLTYKN